MFFFFVCFKLMDLDVFERAIFPPQFHLCLCMHFMTACDQRLYFPWIKRDVFDLLYTLNTHITLQSTLFHVSLSFSIFRYVFGCVLRLFCLVSFLYFFSRSLVFSSVLYCVLKWPPRNHIAVEFPKVWNFVGSNFTRSTRKTRSFRCQMTHFIP